jgi:hypothetical protein
MLIPVRSVPTFRSMRTERRMPAAAAASPKSLAFFS